MKRVRLSIDRLVLKGFRPEDRHVIADSLQRALRRMFADPHAASRLSEIGDVHRMQVGSVRVDQDTRLQRIGEHIAQRINGTKRL